MYNVNFWDIKKKHLEQMNITTCSFHMDTMQTWLTPSKYFKWQVISTLHKKILTALTKYY